MLKMWVSIAFAALFVPLNCFCITEAPLWSPQAAKWPLPHFPGPRDPPQEAKQPLPHFPGLLDPQQPVVTPHICGVDDVDRVPCGEPGIDAAQCGAINCCFDGQQCYYGRTVTVQCTIDGQFVLVVARDTTLPRLSLDSISLLGGSDAPCSAVDSNADFAIYQFPVTACGTRAMELGGYVVYENKMSSSYEVGVGPLGAITRDSHYELYFQCRYVDATVAALAVQLASNNPPMPVAASGPLMVELRLGSGQCVTKGCMQAAYTSYYGDADYPVTKVLREPVYVEVRILGRTDPNIALVLGRCWATSSPDPFSIPQWDARVLNPGLGTPGLLMGRLDFSSPVFIHCSTSVCQLTAADSCEPRCSRQRRKSSHQLTVVSSGEVIFTEKAETVPPELQGNPNLVE
uniref:Zona pellucida sperm-binding protein 4 n=1 Tax=Pygocentrus nattereri TaxID=42514 RepID=A0AAR2K7C8_PYGNA